MRVHYLSLFTILYTISSYAFAANIGIPTACDTPVKISVFGDLFVHSKTFSNTGLQHISDILAWSDFNIANFEGNIAQNRERAYPDFPFALNMPSMVAEFLVRNKINYLTRANNHSMDYGENGFIDTSKTLAGKKIKWTGIGKNVQESYKPLLFSKNGVRIAVFAFAAVYPEGAWATSTKPGVAYPELNSMKAAIAAAYASNDFVIAIFHWGGENTFVIRDYQKTMAAAAISAGANIVIGHHAHHAQGIEMMQNAPVIWGIGNFLFASSVKSEYLSLGALIQFCKNNNLSKFDIVFLPLLTGGKVVPTVVTPMPSEVFKTYASTYLRKKLWFDELKFFLLDANQTKTLADWLK